METWYLISYVFMFFFVASLIGYVCEVVYCSVVDKYFEWNRGFLLGPYVPIYGVGTVVIIYLLRDYYHDPKALFALSFLICTILEYITSFVMERLFKVRWWDYSTIPFNINGRVCLLNSVLFGVAGVIVVYFLRPLVLNVFNFIPHAAMISIATFCEIIFFTDLFVTLGTLISIRVTLTKMKMIKKNVPENESKDGTEKTKDQIVERIRKNVTLYNLLLKAFPYIDGVNEQSFRELRLLVNATEKAIEMGETVVNGTKKVASTTKDVVVNSTKKVASTTKDVVVKSTKKVASTTKGAASKIKETAINKNIEKK